MPIAFKCSCGKAYRVPDAAAGKKMNCKECGHAVKVPSGKSKVKKPAGGDAGDDLLSMDFGIEDDPIPTELPPRRKKDESGGGGRKGKKRSATQKKPMNKGLIIGIGVVTFLVAAVGGFFAVRAMNGSGGGSAPKDPAVVNYETFTHEHGGFSVKVPSGWEKKSAGGTGGVAPTASFEDGTAYISIRHNNKGAPVADMASIPSGGPIIPGAEVEEIPPAKKVHEFMAKTVYSFEFKDFEEQPGQEFTVPFGVGWLSEFTGSEGFSGRKKAYRLTLVGTQFQYNVICKCPLNKWEKYKPIFMEVMKSISR